MYNSDGNGAGNTKGIRCRICTGCGLCPGVSPAGRAEVVLEGSGHSPGALHVLAEDALLGEKQPIRGEGKRLAVADIGTTTIAMLLYHEDGSVADRYMSVNPQTAYGADVLSRIRAAENTECAGDMRRQVQEVLAQGIRRFRKLLKEGESLYLALAANTTMTYLLMGWDSGELGHAPFAASHLEAADIEIGHVPCFIFPCLSAFVGGDILAGICACRMAEREEITLLVDLGTNGEMVLGNCHRRIACATAAGPAFEGGVNKGIWGADMVSLLAALRREGILDGTGLLVPRYFEKGVRIGNVQVTQEAVRGVQLAKAAVAAGIGILLDRYGLSAAQVDRVVLAGGFGYYLKPDAAAEIGLLPGSLAKKAIAGGNTVLTGALSAGKKLLADKREEMLAAFRQIAAGTEILNLAQEQDFGEKYIQAMGLEYID